MPRIEITVMLWDKFVQELHEVHEERALSFNSFLDELLHLGLIHMKTLIADHLKGGGLTEGEAAYQIQDFNNVLDSREEAELIEEEGRQIAERKRRWRAK
jgi:hypothetical protein